MIRDRIEALVRELQKYKDTGWQTEADGFASGMLEAADRLTQILAEEEGGWRPNTVDAPEEPYAWIVVRCEEVYRWAPYKPSGARQMRKTGRWQRLNEYGGFDNDELPLGMPWKPHQNPHPEPSHD